MEKNKIYSYGVKTTDCWFRRGYTYPILYYIVTCEDESLNKEYTSLIYKEDTLTLIKERIGR